MSKFYSKNKLSPRFAWALYLVALSIIAYAAWQFPGQINRLLLSADAAQPLAHAGASGADPAPAKSVLPLVNFSNPGPYKTVLIDGIELRGTRFPAGQFGGTLVRSIAGTDPKLFNPWAASDSVSSELGTLMFSGVLAMDPYDGKMIPDMAESFKVDPDGVTYTTRLRKGLKWSDGVPITADDVTFTWNTIVAGGYGNSSLRDVSTIDGKLPQVISVDRLTNKYVTPKPFAPFIRLLGLPIAPKHIVEPIIKKADGREAFQRLWGVNASTGSFVTSGPFVLKRYVAAQRVEFTATKNYYAATKDGKRLPYLSQLTYLIVPEPNTELLKFKAGEIDCIAVRPPNVAELLPAQKSGNFTMYNLGPSDGTRFLMFNMNRRKNPKGQPYVDPKKSAWFNDVNFRQAVNHAINRDNIVAGYFRGIGTPLFTAEPPVSVFHNPELKAFKPDPQYAMSLLSKSGFKKHDDGNLYDKDGNRVEFTLLTMANSPFCEAAGNYIKNDLKNLGMKVNFQPIAFNVLNDKTANSLDWEAVLMGLTGSTLEPNEGANVWYSNGRLHLFDQRLADAHGNIAAADARPWEKQIDALFKQGALTLDLKKRHEIYNQYQKIIYDQAPFIYIASNMNITAMRNSFHNYQPTPLSQLILGLHNLDELWKK